MKIDISLDLTEQQLEQLSQVINHGYDATVIDGCKTQDERKSLIELINKLREQLEQYEPLENDNDFTHCESCGSTYELEYIPHRNQLLCINCA